MNIHKLFGSAIRPLSSIVALIAGLVSPKAFSQMFPLIQSLNPLENENPVRVLPKSTVFMTRPPSVPTQLRPPSVQDVISKAFNNDDLNALYGAGAFSHCDTSSRIPSFFSKNYSNFVYDCMQKFQNQHAQTFDERFQANPAAQGLATAPLGGELRWENISAPMRERLLQRSINDLAQKNKVLADVIQGRISFDIGLEKLWTVDSHAANPAEVRPRFVVEVVEPQGLQRSKTKKQVASLGPVTASDLGSDPLESGSWMGARPQKSKRVLREVFDSEPRLNTVTVEARQQENTTDSASDSLASFKTLARLAGLRTLPFSKINMRAERRTVDGSQQIALRATESQELFYAEFPNAAQAKSDSLNWGYKIPWKQHAIVVHVNEAAQEKVTGYSYKIDDNNKTDITFNHKSNAVAAGFVVSF